MENRNHDADDRVTPHRLGYATLMMRLMKYQLALDGAGLVAGVQLVNFSIVIRCHSVIRNARLYRIMNVISKKCATLLRSTKIRFSATVQIQHTSKLQTNQSRSPFREQTILMELDSFRFAFYIRF